MPQTLPDHWRGIALVLLATLFPTGAAWLYFVLLAGHEAVRVTYIVAKVAQFLLPVLGARILLQQPVDAAWGPGRTFRWGFLSGALPAAAVIAIYHLTLDGSPLAEQASTRVWAKILDFGIDGPLPYLGMALFLSVIHAFLEEYYWRWFLFRRLLLLRPSFGWAATVSGLAFMSHHVIVIGSYLGREELWTAAVPLSLSVAAGGAFWAWLYHRSGRLTAPWLSHLCVDFAVMWVGYDLIWGA